MTTSSWPVYGQDRLDFRRLVVYLSHHKSFPCSLHIRNHLLAQYSAHVPHRDLADVSSDPAPWRTYNDYRPHARVAAIGNVPADVVSGSTMSDAHDDDDQVWALVTIYSQYSPGWVERRPEHEETRDIVMTVWLSTECYATTLDEVRQTTSAERDLLRFISCDYLPRAARTVYDAVWQGKEVQSQGQSIPLGIYATNHAWFMALQEIAADQSNSPAFEFTRMNPCLSFCLSEQDAIELAQGARSSRWTVETIKETDIDMVQSSNTIRFNRWYLQHHIHRSVLVYDGKPVDDLASYTYPARQQKGAPAGWAYAHNDLSIASLHVAEPYRRNRAGEGGSVGLICLGAMSAKVISAQKSALGMLGYSPDELARIPTPLFSVSEMTKGVAQSFHKSVGFVPFSVTTWGAINVFARHPTSS